MCCTWQVLVLQWVPSGLMAATAWLLCHNRLRPQRPWALQRVQLTPAACVSHGSRLPLTMVSQSGNWVALYWHASGIRQKLRSALVCCRRCGISMEVQHKPCP